MKQLIFVVLSGLAALTGGCASPQAAGTNASEEAVNERVYRTGTNIPQKEKQPQDGVQVYDQEAAQRARDASQSNQAMPGRSGR
jgi:hypothetical protein